MAVPGNPDELRRFGVMFTGISGGGPVKVAPKVLYLDGTLGRGLAAVQDDRALAADEFITAMNGGIAAIGDGLVRIAEHVTEADVRGRDGIMRMFAGGH